MKYTIKVKYPAGNYLFKVNNRNTRKMASFWCLYFWL